MNEALQLAIRQTDAFNLVQTQIGLVRLDLDEGRLDDAEKRFDHLSHVRQGHRDLLTEILFQSGRRWILRNQPDQARRDLERAASEFERLGIQHKQQEALSLLRQTSL